MVSRLTVALLACLVLIVPASASAELVLSHDRVDIEEVSGTIDGVPAPGDRLYLRTRFRSTTKISGVTGFLNSTTPGVNAAIEDAVAPFPSITDVAGGFTRNVDPFDVVLPATGLDCGTRVTFGMQVVANEDTGLFGFSIPTGAPGALNLYADAPARPLNDATTGETGGVVPGVTEFVIEVPDTATGLLKSVAVRLPRLDHPRIGDLRLELIGPDSTKVLLANGRGGSGADMVGTLFSDGGLPIAGAAAPFTGTYAPEQPLRAFEARRVAGPWTLRITDTAVGEAGTLQSWRIEARRAFCAGIPTARLTTSRGGEPVTQIQPGQQVDFDASGSTDTNGQIARYDFDLDGQPGWEIENTTDPTHSFTYPTRGTYPVTVRVTDDSDLTDTETIELPVTDAPVAALAASPPAPLSQTPVVFSAAGSTDADGRIARHEWDLDGNGSFEIDTQEVATTSMTYETPGPRTVTVRVTDNLGARATKQLLVTVQNRPPVAAAAIPALIVLGKEVTLDATASTDADGRVKSYEWDLDGVGGFELDMADEPVLKHTFTEPGERLISLRVTDNGDAGDTEVFRIVVRHAPVVTLAATPNPASPRRPVTVTAVATDDDSAPATLSYEWDLDGNGTFEVAPSSVHTRVVQWPNGGARTVGVRVTDPNGAAATAKVDVLVRNLLPTAEITADRTSLEVGTPLALDARGSTDPDGDVMTYRWDLDGNGSFEHDTGTTGTAVMTYTAPGTARPAVRVTDDDGATSTKAIDITVTGPAPAAPPGSATGAPGVADGGSAAAAPPSALAPPVATLGGTRAAPPAALPPAFTASLTSTPGQRLRAIVRKGLRLTCTGSAAGRCTIVARVSGADARRLGLARSAKRPVVVGRATATLAAGRPAAVTLKLTTAARRRLGRRGARARLLLSGVARDASGREASLSRIVVLRP